MGATGPGSNLTPIDPIKLLRKYMWVLVACAFVGGAIGVVAHFVFLRFAPQYTAQVIFDAQPAEPNVANITNEGVRKDEIDRFMATQSSAIVAPGILEAVAQSPRLMQEASGWAAKHVKGNTINHVDAAEELAEMVRAKPISGTTYISMTVKASRPADAAGIARLVRETYLSRLRQATAVLVSNQQDQINNQIRNLDSEMNDLNDRRARLLKEQSIDSLDEKATALGQRQKIVIAQLSDVNQYITMTVSRLNNMEQMRNAETGITYTDTQRAVAEQDPIVANFRQQIKTLESDLQALREMGIKDGHRDYRRLLAQIDARRQKLSDITEEVLARNFDAEYDSAKRELQNLQAQQQQLSNEADGFRVDLADLNRTLTEITDIERRIAGLIGSRQDASNTLTELTIKGSLSNAARVTVFQQERTPNQPTFPRIVMMVPAGMFLLTGLVGGVILLREVLDQRIKGPSDIALLPRARVVGMIADASEDISNKAGVDTIFRDAPTGLLAEQFRQLRTSLLKQMTRLNCRSLVVLGGMPGSGASSIVANLGLACASNEMKVLIIDGNFRRPAQHRILGINEGPGVADVLAGVATLEAVVQHVPGVSRLDALSVGSSEHRQYERLGGKPMSELLERASTTYDLILIDVAPAVVSGDGLAVANRADASMLVVRANGETRGMVSRLRGELDDCRANHLGVLVNAVRASTGGYMKQNIRTSLAYHTPGAKVGSSIDRDPKSGQ